VLSSSTWSTGSFLGVGFGSIKLGNTKSVAPPASANILTLSIVIVSVSIVMLFVATFTSVLKTCCTKMLFNSNVLSFVSKFVTILFM
jgi:hypothetical protein